MHTAKVVSFLLTAFAFSSAPHGGFSAERAGDPMTPEHVARLKMVSAVKISPSGNQVAYVLSVPREPVKEPSGLPWEELHVVLADGTSRPFITGEVNVSKVDWTPDGKGISFVAKRGKDKYQALYAIPADGGEARKIVSFGSDIGGYSFSPDGNSVAFIAADPAPEDEEKLKEQGFNQEVYEESFRQTRVRIAATGGADAPPRSLDLAGFPSELHWAPRGNLLALALAPTPLVDDDFMERKVHVVDAESGKVISRIENPGKLGEIAWSPDAKHLAFIAAADPNDPSAGRLLVVPAAGGKPVELLPGLEGEFASIAWKDDETISFLSSAGVWTTLGEVRRDGGGHRVRIPAGKSVLSHLSLSNDRGKVAIIGESASFPPEVHILGDGEIEPRRMTHSNPSLDGLALAEQEVVRFRARDGLQLEGILIRPLGEEKGKRYPTILYVHGGPEAHERNGWLTSYARPGQVAAARGFAVFYPNYRGSTGRGVEFSKLGQGDPAGKEFDDLADAADHLVAVGVADREKIGITGGSYGGYATAWAATRLSSRFAAGVMFVGISDLVSKLSTTDIPSEEFLVHSRKKLDENWRFFLERSPIFHAKGARTPLLILHGKDDPRVHPGQSLELYRRLKEEGGAPVRLVHYPGEGHGNRKSAAKLDYHLRMLQWFEHYLKGAGGSPPPPKVEYEKKPDSKTGPPASAAAGAPVPAGE